MARWRNNFPRLLNVQGVNDIRQTEIHRPQQPVPEPCANESEMAIERIKRHTSTGIHQLPTQLIKAGCGAIRSEIHKFITSVWNKEELSEEWNESIIVPIYKKGDKTDLVIIKAYHFCHLLTKLYLT